MPTSVVVDQGFPWGDDRRPDTAWADTVIYELHVKGFTMRNPDIPEELRGTYAGLAHPSSLQHLKELGVTAVELMPVHHFIDGGHLVDNGLVNYWGYDSVGYFAPESRYSSSGDDGDQVREFKAMVRALHAAGLEVILDVVYGCRRACTSRSLKERASASRCSRASINDARRCARSPRRPSGPPAP